MKKKINKRTFQIISGLTTIAGTAAVSAVTLFAPTHTAVINGIIVVVTGAIDEVCTLLMNEASE